MLQPSENWMWWFDTTNQRLMLDLDDDLAFTTAYHGKDLVNAAQKTQAFSIDDAKVYMRFAEKLSHSTLSVPERVQVALNSVAVLRFYKPLMPQSWFFQRQDEYHIISHLELGQLVSLDTDGGRVQLWVIEPQETASICMALSTVTLAPTRTLHRCDVIKVMNDRFAVEQASDSYARV